MTQVTHPEWIAMVSTCVIALGFVACVASIAVRAIGDAIASIVASRRIIAIHRARDRAHRAELHRIASVIGCTFTDHGLDNPYP